MVCLSNTSHAFLCLCLVPVDTTRLLSANGNSVYLDGEGCFNKNDEAAALAGDHHKPSSVQGGGANFYQKMACLGLVKNSETDPHADAAQVRVCCVFRPSVIAVLCFLCSVCPPYSCDIIHCVCPFVFSFLLLSVPVCTQTSFSLCLCARFSFCLFQYLLSAPHNTTVVFPQYSISVYISHSPSICILLFPLSLCSTCCPATL